MSDLIRMSGWVRKLTDNGTVYYVHRSTGESRYVNCTMYKRIGNTFSGRSFHLQKDDFFVFLDVRLEEDCLKVRIYEL